MDQRNTPRHDAPSFGDLRPAHWPLGDDHHTDVPCTPDDKRLGDLLGWYLGSLFFDVNEIGTDYFYGKMTSVDEWSRVARALRIHGLKIVNAVMPSETVGRDVAMINEAAATYRENVEFAKEQRDDKQYCGTCNRDMPSGVYCGRCGRQITAAQSAVAPLSMQGIVRLLELRAHSCDRREAEGATIHAATALRDVAGEIAGMELCAPQSATLRISDLMSRALADTAEMLEEFAQLEKEGPRPGSGCKSRGIEVAVYDYCDAGAEQVRSFVFTDGEAEALVALIRATTDRSADAAT